MGKHDKGNWGIKIVYHGNSGNAEHWYETESERERAFALFQQAGNKFAVKSIKRKKRTGR